jgi:hypothetical protein
MTDARHQTCAVLGALFISPSPGRLGQMKSGHVLCDEERAIGDRRTDPVSIAFLARSLRIRNQYENLSHRSAAR